MYFCFIYIHSYSHKESANFTIPFPRSEAVDSVLSIQVFILNIVRNLNALSLSAVQDKVPRKPRIRHIILCEDASNELDTQRMLHIFNVFWQKTVLNALIVYWNQTGHGFQAVSYTPFPELQLQFIERKQLKVLNEVFADKTGNIYGYPLKATVFYDSSRARFVENDTSITAALDGVDGQLARLIAEKMNATLTMTIPADGQEIGEILNNGSATGALGAIINGSVDFGINMRFYRLNQFEGKVEATLSNGRDDICFLSPIRGKAMDMGSIFRPFENETWVAVGLLIPSYVTLFYLIIWWDKGKHSFIRYFMIFFAYSMQQSSPFNPLVFRQRYLFLLWLFTTLIISSLFQAKMSGSLIMPKELPDYDTIEELSRSNLKIMSLERYNRQMAEFLRDKRYHGVYDPLIKRFVNCTLDEFYEKIGEFDKNFGFANKDHINAYLRSVYKYKSQVFFHQVKQCAIPYLGVYGIKYGTPYKGRINFIIRQAQEGGLVELWERSNKVIDTATQGGDELQAFSVKNLQMVFYVFWLGCIICIFSFIGELVFYRWTIGKWYRPPNK